MVDFRAVPEQQLYRLRTRSDKEIIRAIDPGKIYHTPQGRPIRVAYASPSVVNTNRRARSGPTCQPERVSVPCGWMTHLPAS